VQEDFLLHIGKEISDYNFKAVRVWVKSQQFSKS
jgi:hypothetical protein